jgi:hypothetical protein
MTRDTTVPPSIHTIHLTLLVVKGSPNSEGSSGFLFMPSKFYPDIFRQMVGICQAMLGVRAHPHYDQSREVSCHNLYTPKHSALLEQAGAN